MNLAVYLALAVAAIAIGAELLLPLLFLGYSYRLARTNTSLPEKKIDYQHVTFALIAVGVAPVMLFGRELGASVTGILGEGYPYEFYRSALKEALDPGEVEIVANTVAGLLVTGNVLVFLVLPVLDHVGLINLSSSRTQFFNMLLTTKKAVLAFSAFYIAYVVQWISGSGVLFAKIYYEHNDVIWAVAAVQYAISVCLLLFCVCAARGLASSLARKRKANS